MKRVLAVVVAAALLAIPVAAAVIWWPSEETRTTAGIREAAPDDLHYWIEAPDLESVWASMQGTQALSDLRASGIPDWLSAEFAGSEAAAELRTLSARSGIELDAETLFRFAGEHAGLGLRPDAAQTGYEALLLTPVDRVAIAKELIGGSADYRRLWEELRTRTGNAGVGVRTEPYRDYTLAEFTYQGGAVWGVLMEELLALATTRDLLVTSVDLRLADGAGSLARSDRFAEELARLPDEAALVDWIHLAAIREAPTALLHLSREIPADGLDQGLTEVLRETARVPAFARAWSLRGGDLYGLDWSNSRSFEDVFGPRAAELPTGRALGDDLLFATEVHDASRALVAFQGSALLDTVERTLSEGEFAETLRSGLEAESDDGPLSRLGDHGDRRIALEFVRRMGWELTRRQLEHTLGSGAGVAVTLDEHHSPRGVAVVRLGLEGRILAAIALHASFADEDVRRVERGGLRIAEVRRVNPFDESLVSTSMAWTVDADLLVVASTVDDVEATLRGSGAALPAGLRDAWRELDDRAILRVHMNLELMLSRLGEKMGRSSPLMSLGDDLPAWITAGLDVGPNLAWIVADFVSPMPESMSPKQRLDGLQRSGTPLRVMEVFPEDTLLVSGYDVDLAHVLEQLREMLRLRAQEQAAQAESLGLPHEEGDSASAIFEEGLDRASTDLGVDLEDTWLPSLSGEFATGLVFREQRRLRGMPPSAPALGIPDLVVVLGLRERGPSEALMRGIEDLVARETADSGRPSPIARATLSGQEVIWFDPSPDMAESMGVAPDVALGLVGDWLVLASSRRTFEGVAQAAAAAATGDPASFVFRIEELGLRREGTQFHYWDLDRTIDQIAESRSLVAQFVDTDVAPPEYEVGDSQETWGRKLAAYQQDVEQRQEAQVSEFLETLDAFRWLHYVALTGWYEGRRGHGRAVLTFVPDRDR